MSGRIAYARCRGVLHTLDVGLHTPGVGLRTTDVGGDCVVELEIAEGAKFHVKGSHEAFDVGFDHKAFFGKENRARTFGAFEFESEEGDIFSVEFAVSSACDADFLVDDLLLIDAKHFAFEGAPGFGLFEWDGKEIEAGGLKVIACKAFGELFGGFTFLAVDHDLFVVGVSPCGGFFAAHIGVGAELDELTALIIAAAVVFPFHPKEEIADFEGATVKDDDSLCGVEPFFACDLAGLGATKEDIVREDALS